MNTAVAKAVNFLKAFGMDYRQFSMEKVSSLFLKEMENGLSGRASSLMMLPTFLDAKTSIPQDEPVIVLDAGGTNFRTASVLINRDGIPEISNFTKFPMPGTSGHEVGKTEFFDTIVSYLKDTVNVSSRIGFCFSYPTEMLPTGDGRLITFTKEVKAPEVEGAAIGKNLLAALNRAGYGREKKIVILNDTVAALLASLIGNKGKQFDTYAGFILGTGMNSCYIEENSEINGIDPGIPESGRQIINIESGKFALFEGGIIDQEFSALTDKPDESKFEKKISGAYQGPLALAVLKKAAENSLFSAATSKNIQDLTDLETRTMDGFLHTPYNRNNNLAMCIGNEDDRTVVFTLLDRLIERAAKLTAASLAAVVIKTGKGSSPAKPVCIAADGTTYFKTKGLQFRTEYYLKDFLENKHNLYTEFTSRDDAPLIGAAVAALQQN